jgi:hypothetical protein
VDGGAQLGGERRRTRHGRGKCGAQRALAAYRSCTYQGSASASPCCTVWVGA